MPKLAKVFTGSLEQALEKWPNNLYIKNSSKERSTLLIDIKDSNDKILTIKLPKTWVPLDVLSYVGRDSVQKSNLRTYLRSGLIQILEADTAHEIATSKEGIQEAVRVGLLNPLYAENIMETDVQEDEGVVVTKSTPNEPATPEMSYVTNMKEDILGCSSDEEALPLVKDLMAVVFADPQMYVTNINNVESIKTIENFLKEKEFNKSVASIKDLTAFITAQ